MISNTSPKRLIAMRGTTACAMATISRDVQRSPDGLRVIGSQGSLVLEAIVRNANDGCKGGAAAIICHMIRSSTAGHGSTQWAPMKLVPTNPTTKSYFETYGCYYRQAKSVWMFCEDPDPPKCVEESKQTPIEGDIFFDDEIWVDKTVPKLKKTQKKAVMDTPGIIGIQVSAMVGITVGIGIVIGMPRSRRNVEFFWYRLNENRRVEKTLVVT